MQKNMVLMSLAELLMENKQFIIDANKEDMSLYSGNEEAMLDRLKVDEKKVLGQMCVSNIYLFDPLKTFEESEAYVRAESWPALLKYLLF